MQRTLLSMVALLGLAVAAVPATAEMSQREQELYEAAKANGEKVTWYVAHFNSETAEALGSAFREKYEGVDASVVRTTAQVAFQRLTQDLRSDVANCDVFSSTDIGHYVFLKDEGLLEQYTPENSAKMAQVYQDLDPEGYYHVTSAGTVLLTYNTDKVTEDEAPKTWTDLLDPKWKDQVSVGHPGFSGYVGTWVVMMRKLYGWEYFEKLEQNNPQIGRSINDTVTMLNAGERSVAAGPGATTQRSAARGNPLAVVYPEDGTLLMLAPSAIINNTQNPNAAKLFMEFLMGPEAARVSAENYSESVRPDVPSYPGAKNLDDVKTIRPSVQEIEEGIPEVKELWRDTFGV